MDYETFGFDTNLKELEKIVKKLEKSNENLEENLKLYEQGIKLCNICEKKLKEAELKIENLTTE